MKHSLFTILFLFSISSVCLAQTTTKFNLSDLLNKGSLVINPRSTAIAMADDNFKGISCTGIVWLKGMEFSTGSIDVDLRGKDVFQQSFLGIAFHGVDSITNDVIYFRPFNFNSPDTLRRKHMVQYISEPDYSWDRLRKEHPLVYENTVIPQVAPTDWFHARIVVDADSIRVYVNHATTPCLAVKKLNTRSNGLIGLWNDGLPGDFANLVIINDKQ
jgi:hypothetical protein